MKKTILFVLLLSLFCTALPAQESSSQIMIIRTMTESRDPDQKMAALEGIEELMQDPSLKEETLKEIIDILTNCSRKGTVNVQLDESRNANENPLLRLEAVRLLGETRSPDALEAVISVIQFENHPHIISAAIRSAALIGVNDKKLNAVFYLVMTGQESRYKNESLVHDVLLAINAIFENDESILYSGKIIEGLITVSMPRSGFTRETRNLAEELLKKL